MKRTALILAGAAVFDLGIMAVAAQAQSRTQAPVPRTGGPGSPGSTGGGAVVAPTGSGGCTPSGVVVPGSAGRPCAPALKLAEDLDIFKIDSVNTVESCLARRGEVVMQEGQRQCQLPNRDPAARGTPIGAPGGPGGPPVGPLPDDPSRLATGTNPEGRQGVRLPPVGNRRPGASPPVRQD